MTVIDILEELEATPGRNDKEAILETHSDDELLKRVFVAAQNPYVVFYVNKFKMPAVNQSPASCDLGDDAIVSDFIDMLETELATRNVTGNAAKDLVTSRFAQMDTSLLQKWCQRILLKNLRCGVQASTVNKVWPGAIGRFDVQLACTLKTSYDKEKGIQIDGAVDYPVRVEPKLDGLRCIAVKHNGIVSMFTRNGSVLETMPRVKAALEKADYDDFVLDGEAMGADWNESASVLMSHKTQKDDSNIVYNVFDAMPYTDWVDQASGDPLEERITLVEALLSLFDESSPVKQVKGNTVKTEKELFEFYAGTMNHGYEGIMLKDLSKPYVFKRSEAILKMKPVVTYEGVVIGHYEGRRGTKREGMWGGFDVILPNGVITRLGGGFNDKFRTEVLLEGPDAFVGRIVEMEGQPDPLTKDGLTYDGKVRFPVYMRIRDKSDVDPKVIQAYEEFMSVSAQNKEYHR
jgi:hypothetical protein